MIKLEHISKSFNKNKILDNISLTIESKQIVGIFGANGIGKSTLAKIICGLETMDEGKIYFNDTLLYESNQKYNRKIGLKIQMVYQQPFAILDPTQKIRNSFYELIRYYHLTDRKNEKEFVNNLGKRLNLDKDILNHLPSQLSGGEAQRVAIGKCLLFKPELIILDEATSMLDVSTQANILAFLKEESQKLNASILIISHDENLLKNYCDITYELKDKTLKEKRIFSNL